MPSIADIMAMAQAAGGTQATHTILIIDDDPGIRAILRTALGKANKALKFIEASDGSEAIDYLSSTEKLPAIVITDIMMPNMNGKQAITRLRRKHSKEKLPIIVCTASNSKPLIVELLGLGVNDVIIKPIDIQTVGARVLKWLPVDLSAPNF
jgi:DNA-binding response OmpR family regulator